MTERPHFDDEDLESILHYGLDGARDLRHLIADLRAAVARAEAAEARIAAALALADEWSRECITGGGGDVMAADLRAALTVEEPTDG